MLNRQAPTRKAVKAENIELRFLGTGTSHGIPVIGCSCRVCQSQDSRDHRCRASVIVKSKKKVLLIDAGPELRLQLLGANISQVDGLLLTHAHADHIAGLDDVRIFSERSGEAFPVYGSAATLQQVKKRFDYVFRPTQKGGGKPRLALHTVTGPFQAGGMAVVPLPVWHGRIRVLGYRVGGLAYLTDVSHIPKTTYPLLARLKVVVLDALRPEPHATHFHLEQAVAEAGKINAKRTFLTHMCHRLQHAETENQLPRSIRLAYDGLKVKV